MRNLIGLLDEKLATTARLQVFAYEAAQEGLDGCAELFERVALAEREQIDELTGGLRRYLDAEMRSAPPAGTPAT